MVILDLCRHRIKASQILDFFQHIWFIDETLIRGQIYCIVNSYQMLRRKQKGVSALANGVSGLVHLSQRYAF